MDGKDFRKITVVIEALRRHREFQILIESREPFLIYHTETGRVLARGIYGYANARDASNKVRKQLKLKVNSTRVPRIVTPPLTGTS